MRDGNFGYGPYWECVARYAGQFNGVDACVRVYVHVRVRHGVCACASLCCLFLAFKRWPMCVCVGGGAGWQLVERARQGRVRHSGVQYVPEWLRVLECYQNARRRRAFTESTSTKSVLRFSRCTGKLSSTLSIEMMEVDRITTSGCCRRE